MGSVLRVILPYAIAALIAASAAWWVQSLRWDADVSQIRQAQSDALSLAQSKARAAETRMQTMIDEVQADAELEREKLQADIAAAAGAADSLRTQLAERTRRVAADTCPAGSGQAAISTLVLYSELLDRADQRAGDLAGYADAARQAGLACERAWEGLR